MMLRVESKPLLGENNAEIIHPSDSFYTPFVSLKSSNESVPKKNALGTTNGVYIPCLLNIIGVILFLRLGWAIGQAGVWGVLLIFALAELQALFTVLSASAIASNGIMHGGGSYFLLR